jgi:ADP-ribose pyrophosphatase YjhB (NUDIX family)
MARRDYFHDPEAPKPNPIRPAAAVALFDSRVNILLLRRKDNDKWIMPGGTLDFGESLTDWASREVREETGLRIRITGLVGTYTNPHILIAYSDGKVRQEFTFVYTAEIESGELNIDDESKEAAWVPLSSAVELPLARIATAQAEGRYGVSEGAADIFEVTPMSPRHSAHCCCFRE